MTRKGNQQRNGLDRNSSSHKTKVSDSWAGSVPEDKEKAKAYRGKVGKGEGLQNCNQPSPSEGRANRAKSAGEGKRSNQKSRNASSKGKPGMDSMLGTVQSASVPSNPKEPLDDVSTSDVFKIRGDDGTSLGCDHSSKYPSDSLGCLQHGLPTEDAMEGSGSSDAVVGRSLGAFALSILKVASGWLERQKPLITTIMTILSDAGDYTRLKIEQAYPIVWRWLLHFGSLMLVVFMVWLDCSLRGLVSFLRLGTTSFFAIIWYSILSSIAMVGVSKFLMMMVVAGLVAFFVGFTFAILVIAISATVFLWMYGSFWTTGLVFFVGGLGFALKYERFALFITTVYSIYSAKTYVGWLGLFLGLNLSFFSSDVLIHFLKNNIHERSRSADPQEQAPGMQGQPASFYSEQTHASEHASGRSTDRSPGAPSTSGTDVELTSEDEVVCLLNCTDHYSALGLSRYENIDVSLLKREYRRKAMLVHPDKNMGNEKAAEAFKKLQNAYEVLLDSSKRKAYDDELRREELLNWFRRFQSTSQKNGRHGPFAAGFTRPEADGDGDSKRIACKKCGNFHTWVHTSRSKSRARWCQDCRDFHQAKDGDGWVEQSLQPLFFGLLQKVDAPSAYVCAESRIYNATEWFVCQGMKCPANTHKPSFHVNTSLTSKHGAAKGSGSGQRGPGIPTTDMEEIMTEEEFLEWLQKAMQSGMFEATGGSPSTESPPARAGNCSKSSGNSNSNKKKKGKKQW